MEYYVIISGNYFYNWKIGWVKQLRDAWFYKSLKHAELELKDRREEPNEKKPARIMKLACTLLELNQPAPVSRFEGL